MLFFYFCIMCKRSFLLSIPAVFFLSLLWGCSLTRYVPDDAYLLQKNTVTVESGKEISASTLETFLRQKPNSSIIFGWKTFLQIYNLSPREDNGWSRFLKKMGEPPVLFDSLLIQRSIMNIDNHLVSLGYYNNNISSRVEYDEKKARVNYYVKPGKTYAIDTIVLRSEDPAISELYYKTLNQSLIGNGSVLASSVLDSEASRLNALMRNNGYYDFNKNLITFRADTLKGDGTAKLEVLIPGQTPHKIFKIRKVNVYTGFDPIRAAMDSGYYATLDSLVYNGMTLYFSDRPDIRPKLVSSLNFIRPGDTYNESVVKTTYNRFSSIRLFNGVTLLFDKVEEQVPADTAAVDCTIRLSPGNLQGYKLNLEASSNSNGLIGVSPVLSYYHKNIFRGGEWLTVSFMGNFQFKIKDPIRATELGTSMTLTFPKMLFPISGNIFKNHIPRTDVSASYNYQSRPEYTRNIAITTFGYTWRMRDRFFYTVNPIKLKLVKLHNLSPSFLETLKDPFILDTYRDHFDLGLSSLFYYTTDNSAVPVKSYFYFRGGAEAAGNVLSAFNSLMKTDTTGAHLIGGIAYSQYVKFDINTAYTWISGRHQLAGRLFAGVGIPYGNANSLPLEQMFFSGGANSLRGWQARTVGPGSMPVDSTFSIPNQSGDVKLEVNLEYRFPVFWKVEGALFADAGNIWTLPKRNAPDTKGTFRFKNFMNSVAMDAGLGIRLNLSFVVLRLDLGMIMRDPVQNRWIPANEWLKRNNYSFQFGVGYPF